MAPEDLQNKIALGLSWRLRDQLVDCTQGDCGGGCGDVCAIRARNWRQSHAQLMRNIFSDPALTVHEVYLSCTSWHESAGCLADVNVQSIRKAASRALDSLREPKTIAAGLIDAAWSGSKWKVGISIFVRTPRDTDIHRTFDRTENIDWLDAELSAQPYSRLKQLLRDGQHAKTWPDRRILLKPGVCREYYRWLASLKPRARLFRYGCDHHFNVRPKSLKPVKWRLPKCRPSPTWLTSYQYGSHPDCCECNICRSRQNQ
jgi:hypothetical protein